jgi:hypothetical protein
MIKGLLRGDTPQQAYFNAGYTGDPAYAYKIISTPAFKKRYNKALAPILRRGKISKAQVLKELKRIAYSDPADLYDLDGETLLSPAQLPKEVRRAIKSFKRTVRKDGSVVYEYTFWDKNRAHDQLHKIMGLYERDNRQRAADVKVMPVEIAFVKPESDDAS